METGWNSQRITAIVRLVVMVVSAIAGGFGLAVDADGLFTVIMCVVAAVAAVWSWWANNNVTKAAQHAQEYLDAIKKGEGDD